jgi:hypothetical protein
VVGCVAFLQIERYSVAKNMRFRFEVQRTDLFAAQANNQYYKGAEHRNIFFKTKIIWQKKD